MKKLFILFVLCLLFLTPSQTYAITTLSKSAHIEAGTNAATFNQLHNDFWKCMNSCLSEVYKADKQAPYEQIDSELFYSVPWSNAVGTLEGLETLDNFHGMVEIGNEPDLNNHTPQEAADNATVQIDRVLSVYPDATIVLQFPSQAHFFDGYGQAFLDALPQTTIDKLDGVAIHYYPQPAYKNGLLNTNRTVDRVYDYIVLVKNFMNTNGIGSLDLYLTETGLDAALFPAHFSTYYVTPLYNKLSQLSYLKLIDWFCAWCETLSNQNYREMVLPDQSVLTGTGIKWGLIP